MSGYAETIWSVQRVSATALSELLNTAHVMSSAQEKAAQIIADAYSQAAAIREQATQEIEIMHRSARQQLEDQRALMVEQFTEEVTAITAADVIDVAEMLTDRFDALRPWMSELILNAVSQVIGTLAPDAAMLRALEQALLTARRDWSVRLLCCPDDLPLLRHLITTDSVAPDGPFKGVTGIFADHRLNRGECLLESDGEVMQIGITAQISALRSVLANDGGAQTPLRNSADMGST